MASMTALQKQDGGVRGIATGTSFRRIVAKCLARQHSDEVESACSPFQLALSTKAGTVCVGHAIRAATVANPSDSSVHRWTWCSRSRLPKFNDGQAFGGSRVAVVVAFREIERTPVAVHMGGFQGQHHVIEQHVGGEQRGSIDASALQSRYSQCSGGGESKFAWRRAFFRFSRRCVRSHMARTNRGRVQSSRGVVVRHGRIQLHSGKTRTWNKAGIVPQAHGRCW